MGQIEFESDSAEQLILWVKDRLTDSPSSSIIIKTEEDGTRDELEITGLEIHPSDSDGFESFEINANIIHVTRPVSSDIHAKYDIKPYGAVITGRVKNNKIEMEWVEPVEEYVKDLLIELEELFEITLLHIDPPDFMELSTDEKEARKINITVKGMEGKEALRNALKGIDLSGLTTSFNQALEDSKAQVAAQRMLEDIQDMPAIREAMSLTSEMSQRILVEFVGTAEISAAMRRITDLALPSDATMGLLSDLGTANQRMFDGVMRAVDVSEMMRSLPVIQETQLDEAALSEIERSAMVADFSEIWENRTESIISLRHFEPPEYEQIRLQEEHNELLRQISEKLEQQMNHGQQPNSSEVQDQADDLMSILANRFKSVPNAKIDNEMLTRFKLAIEEINRQIVEGKRKTIRETFEALQLKHSEFQISKKTFERDLGYIRITGLIKDQSWFRD